jgi:predicted GH43/DUF377 family glycosyl hydrolase
MEYVKKGLIFQANNNHEWMYSYAAQPSAIEFDTFIRIYFTTRKKLDEKGHFNTYVTFIDCDKNDPSNVLYVHDKPLLEFGLPGAFDEHGTMLGDVLFHDNKYYLYYVSWQRSDTVPYINWLGLAISDDGVNFTKVSDGPVIGSSRFLPYGIACVSALVEDGIFHLWYTHYTPWIKTSLGYRPTYDIGYAYSENGMDWKFGEKSIPSSNSNEAIATPCVRKINGKYHMWYSVRPGVDVHGKSGPYRIGYAVSDDKKTWKRMDETVDIHPSESGWDSEMVCYPDVLQTNEKTFLFYCGNNYGRDGFGYVELKNI